MLTVTTDDPYIVVHSDAVPDGSRVYLNGNKQSVRLKVTKEDSKAKIGPVPERLCNGVYVMEVHPSVNTCCGVVNTYNVNVQMQTLTPIVVHEPTDPAAGETITECCEAETETEND